MNSEELEQSLRTEFEGYLKNVLAEVTQEVSQFQQKIDTEIEKHKSHLDEVFQEFSTRIQTQRELDEGFKESVVEHLRLARDEGARITATAMAEAEELTKSERKPSFDIKPSGELGYIRDAINDISSQNSQSSILKSLITHAARFTPRGAFFVVKNQHFVGWRVFGKEENVEVAAITDIVFPFSASTILGESVNSLGSIESTYGTYADDAEYLAKLEFSEPDKIFAIPLIARGRGVAAIYADNGSGSDTVNLEALETLVSVAGLTVELLASAQGSSYSREPASTGSYDSSKTAESDGDYETEAETFGEREIEEVEETTGFDYVEAGTESVSEVESEETYDLSESEVAEAETAASDEDENVSETGTEESEAFYPVAVDSEAEEVSAHDSEEAVEETVYEVAAEIESFDENEVQASEMPEEAGQQESSEPAYGLIDEESAAVDETDGVYQAELMDETQTEDADEDESDFEEIQATEVYDDKIETVAEISEADSTGSGFESDFGIYDSAVDEIEVTEISDDVSAPAQYPEFETNQDYNSTPVQFEEPASAFEAEDIETGEPEIAEIEAKDEIEEISVSGREPEGDEEFSEDGSGEEVEPPAGLESPPVFKTRFSDRDLDLPIEVSEDERRLHNDARRFARLLVSEIKLYNEQKVNEGRASNDLYERLREALDRSREMYDKRVQPSVVERFDYFHYEVVNTLAEGEESKLGAAYPGAAVPA